MSGVPIDGLFSVKLRLFVILGLMISSYPDFFKWIGLSINQTQKQLILGGIWLFIIFLCFSTAVSPSFRGLVVSKKRLHLYDPAPFVFIGFLACLLGSGALVFGILMSYGICLPHRNIRC